MQALVERYAVTDRGPLRLSTPPGAHDVNEAFDDVPLGIYEGLRTFEHTRFIGLREHIERAERSLIGAGSDFKLERRPLCRCLHDVVSAYSEPEARVRFDVLAEPARALGTESRVLIALSPHRPTPRTLLDDGVSVHVVRELTRRAPLIKTADFVLTRRVYATGDQASFENVLLGPGGELLEGASSNFFAVKNGEICTAGSGVLEGVTRLFVLRLARSLGFRISETPVTLAELGDVTECFLTSSTRGVMPIVGVDNARIADGRPGPATRTLMRAYDEFVTANARDATGEV